MSMHALPNGISGRAHHIRSMMREAAPSVVNVEDSRLYAVALAEEEVHQRDALAMPQARQLPCKGCQVRGWGPPPAA